MSVGEGTLPPPTIRYFYGGGVTPLCRHSKLLDAQEGDYRPHRDSGSCNSGGTGALPTAATVEGVYFAFPCKDSRTW